MGDGVQRLRLLKQGGGVRCGGCLGRGAAMPEPRNLGKWLHTGGGLTNGCSGAVESDRRRRPRLGRTASRAGCCTRMRSLMNGGENRSARGGGCTEKRNGTVEMVVRRTGL
ncbi:hypothetical protein SESBI_41594 [Sesbania bispinosa]|nr:hypothetical protein SESBI_41594 [Sesbania bispinosa]